MGKNKSGNSGSAPAESEPLLSKQQDDIESGSYQAADGGLVNRGHRVASGDVGDIHAVVESAFTVQKGENDAEHRIGYQPNLSAAQKEAEGVTVTNKGDTAQKEAEGVTNNVTLFSLTVNLILCALGIGILTQPAACMKSGMAWGFLSIIVVNIFNGLTNCLFIQAAHKYQVFDMESLLELTSKKWGKMFKYLSVVAIWVSFILVLMGTMTNIAKQMNEIGVIFDWQFFGLGSEVVLRRVVLAASCPIIIVLCLFDQSWLSGLSVASIGINVYLIVVVLISVVMYMGKPASDPLKEGAGVVHGLWPDSFTPVYDKASGPDSKMEGVFANSASVSDVLTANLQFVCALIMAVAIQPCVIPMYEELKLDIRTPKTFYKATAYSTIFLVGLFAVVNFAAVYSYNIALINDDNLISAIMTDSSMYTAIKSAIPIGFAFVGVSMYPFMILPMTAPLKKSLSSASYLMLNVGLVVMSAVVPALPTDPKKFQLSSFNDLNGALSLFFFMGIFPLLVGYKLLGYKLPMLSVVAAVTLVGCVAQCYFTFRDMAIPEDAPKTTFASYMQEHQVTAPSGQTGQEMNGFHSFAHRQGKDEQVKFMQSLRDHTSQSNVDNKVGNYYPFYFLLAK